jgi:hypothetical protein
MMVFVQDEESVQKRVRLSKVPQWIRLRTNPLCLVRPPLRERNQGAMCTSSLLKILMLLRMFSSAFSVKKGGSTSGELGRGADHK